MSVLPTAINKTEENRIYLEDLLRWKPHRLNCETERVLTAGSTKTLVELAQMAGVNITTDLNKVSKRWSV